MWVNDCLIVIRLGNITVNNGLHFTGKSPVSISISGHAGSDVKGKDIVCSAVSVLSQTLVLSIGRLLKVDQTVQIKDGLLTSTVQPVKDADEENKLKLLIESFLIGILEIDREYPGRVKIENEVF